jgi:hypothetical protein
MQCVEGRYHFSTGAAVSKLEIELYRGLGLGCSSAPILHQYCTYTDTLILTI